MMLPSTPVKSASIEPNHLALRDGETMLAAALRLRASCSRAFSSSCTWRFSRTRCESNALESARSSRATRESRWSCNCACSMSAVMAERRSFGVASRFQWKVTTPKYHKMSNRSSSPPPSSAATRSRASPPLLRPAGWRSPRLALSARTVSPNRLWGNRASNSRAGKRYSQSLRNRRSTERDATR